MTDQEVNIAVARKLGWNKTDKGNWNRRHECGGEVMLIKGLPDYCHSILAAWEILTYSWADNDINWHLMFNPTTRKAHCCIGKSEAEADTAPMAVCLAFLKLP